MSYVYSCINPFALYFLSSTFRHFYKHYLFFWTSTSCCNSKRHLVDRTQRRRTGELGTFSECQPRSSANNFTNVGHDLNRRRNSNLYQPQSPVRKHRCMTYDGTSAESGTPLNGTFSQSAVTSAS